MDFDGMFRGSHFRLHGPTDCDAETESAALLRRRHDACETSRAWLLLAAQRMEICILQVAIFWTKLHKVHKLHECNDINEFEQDALSQDDTHTNWYHNSIWYIRYTILYVKAKEF